MSKMVADDQSGAGERPEAVPPGMFGPDGKPRFFDEPGMDRFVAVILNMAGEMWVMEERLRALEGREDGDPGAARAFVDRLFEPLREAR